MARTTGKMYNFVTHTANPIAGDCMHKCSYCYVNNLKERFIKIANKYSGSPRLDELGMLEISGKHKTIFVCDMADLFADNVPTETIEIILLKCKEKQANKYLFQTKNPKRLLSFIDFFPEKTIICSTIETNRHYAEIMGNSPKPFERAKELMKIQNLNTGIDIFITIEPILDFDLQEFTNLLESIAPKQINIGYDSKQNNLPEPSKEKVSLLITELEKFSNILLK